MSVGFLRNERKVAEHKQSIRAASTETLAYLFYKILTEFGLRIFADRQIFRQKQTGYTRYFTDQFRDMPAKHVVKQTRPDGFSIVIPRYYKPLHFQLTEYVFGQIKLFRFAVICHVSQDNDSIEGLLIEKPDGFRNDMFRLIK